MNLSYKLLILAALFLVGCAKNSSIIPGTSLELAQQRKNTISNVEYRLFFQIPEAQEDSIPARVDVQFDLRNTSPVLQLDFNAPTKNILEIKVNGKPLTVRHENEHILVDRDFLHDGKNEILIDFVAGEAALNRNSDYLYTLFVPSRASTCFPVFDQPDMKAIYLLELNIPLTWQAISNGSAVSIDTVESQKNYRFSATKPTSTYQFAFTAGKFHSATDPQSGMTMLYRETDSAKVARNLSSIFELHRQSLDWLKNYTGIEYPYEKFGFALMPAFQFGGMEHPGNIFYRESSLFLDPSASVNDELRRASLIAHETAHMWFGNLVTMKWFNDVWLKEVFANFMAAKIVGPSFPGVNHQLRFLMAHYPSAYEIDRSEGAHPIQQQLDNLKNAGSVYGAIIYQKAPIMMRNLESLMGEEKFRQGLQEYLKTFSYGNATWDDLIAVMKRHTDQNLEIWDRAWIKTKGMPELELRDDTSLRVANDPDGTVIWPQSFVYQTMLNGSLSEINITVSSNDPIKLSLNEKEIIPNFKGRGYGYFKAKPDYMILTVNSHADPEVRAGIWINLWEYMLRGEIRPDQLFPLFMDAVKTESNPLLLEYVCDKISNTFWQFMVPAQRSLVSAQLDEALFVRMSAEKDNSIKRTLLSCYRRVAISPGGVQNLKKIWGDAVNIGLTLSERDRIQLMYELMVREAEGHEAIVKAQVDKISNPDKKKEVLFILPALSSDPVMRDQFFESLKNPENRSHEPWVLEALHYLHHPLRTPTSIKYVKASVELLEEIQRTGDIFFPKGWLDGTLGGYQSTEAVSIVRDYLQENTTLRQDLRNKLLQSSDMLFRAEQIVKSRPDL